ncbi:ATP-grasp domain-containing protein [Exiguobacterium aurantiacum]|uniref:ATP-grasp domain-containing protein n=1 Tax=Exiguobacterium aurantiacum TaxID=33987 RepID=UPI00384FD13A
MKKIVNIFVTGVGGDIGHGILNCLSDINYHKTLVGCDTNEYSMGRPQVEYFYVVPPTAKESEYIKSVLYICSKHKINYIIPTSENEIKIYNKYRALFNSKKINLVINDSEIIETFFDKYKTIEFFKKNKIKYPDTILLDKYKNEFGFPVILKLRNSSGSRGVFVANDVIDINYYKKKYDEIIVQEMIGDSDNEFTIGVFSDGKELRNIAFQRHLGYGSLSRQVKLVSDYRIDDLVYSIAKAINLKGSINIQVRRNEHGDYIPFEINPRISSTVQFRHFFGFEDIRWWLDLHLGNENTYIKRYHSGVGVRSLSTVYFKLNDNGDRV